MAERYNKLYTLPSNLYAASCPVIIAAGALLKDSQTGRVLCQLKFRNISTGRINALKLLVLGYDMSGEEVCREEHQYLDLKVGRNGVFGAKEAIPLPEKSVRSYTAQVQAVYFEDGSRWFHGEEVWEPLPEQLPLRSRLFDRELIRQYKLGSTDKSEFVPSEYKDLWFCACGDINREGDACAGCGQELDSLMALLDVDRLLEDKNQRLMEEAKKAAQRESSRGQIAKVVKIVLLVLIPVALAAGALWFFQNRANEREAQYQIACVMFEAGQYSEAAAAFDAMGDYEDSEAKANQARAILSELNQYEKATKFLENGRYDDAYNAFSSMGDYKDAPELMNEALYRKALELAEKGECDSAREMFIGLGDYKDSAQLCDCFVMLLTQEETSYNPECEGPLSTSYNYDEAGKLLSKTQHFSVYEGLSDRVLTYEWGGDGSYTETEYDTVRSYDAWGILVAVNGESDVSLDYGYYDNGMLQYVGEYDAEGNFLGEKVYDEQGNIIRYSNADGSTSETVNEYDEEGRLVKQENFDSEGKFIDRTSFEYDAEGHLKRSTYMDLESVTAVTNYSYEMMFKPGMASK